MARSLICCATPALRSTLVALVKPQCTQSKTPCVVSCAVPDGVAMDPLSAPPLPAAVTVKPTFVLRVMLPLEAIIVIGYVPVAVPPAAEMVMTEELPGETVPGLNVAVAPGGSPVALKITVPADPGGAAAITVNVILPPTISERAPGV